jgi:hypothetical protein
MGKKKSPKRDTPLPPLKTGSNIPGRSPGAFSGSEPKASDMYQPQSKVTYSRPVPPTKIVLPKKKKPASNRLEQVGKAALPLNPLKLIIDALNQKKPKKPKR